MRFQVRPVLRNIFGLHGTLILSLVVFLCACSGRNPESRSSVEFDKVPPTGAGGPAPVSQVTGHARGAHAGQKIVLYAQDVNGVWWVQPQAIQPFIPLKPDSSWETSTHLGTQYAALLIDAGYRPPATTKVLPHEGDKVEAITIVKGVGPLVRLDFKEIQFSGYEWKAMNTVSERNGTPNVYDAANASTDDNGRLHLRILKKENQWTCSEVILPHSFGYGTYLFSVEDISHLPPAAVLTLFLWDDLGAEQNHREMDIEISRWGDPDIKNAQFVMQPYYVPENVVRFAAPTGRATYSFQWGPQKASFRAVRGDDMTPQHDNVANHIFTSGVPSPGSENVSLNFCPFGFSKMPLDRDAEVVIDKFQYLP